MPTITPDMKPVKPLTVCLACAGPIVNNTVSFTNRAWVIDGTALAKTMGLRKVDLVNDFVGMGYGLLTLDVEKECLTLNEGHRVLGGPMGCVGAGTGLGECYLTAHEKGGGSGGEGSSGVSDDSLSSTKSADPASQWEYTCHATEGGHTDFAPRNAIEAELLHYLREKYATEGSTYRISNERVVAGSGIPNVYEFLCQRFPESINKDVDRKIKNAGDLQAAMIAKNSRGDGKCILCEKTMDIFLTHYGSEAGNCCLKWYPTGGLFITGGLTPKNLDRIKNPNDLFLPALFEKGRVSVLIRQCPIYAVLVEDLGERGAHLVAFRALQRVLTTDGTLVEKKKKTAGVRVPLVLTGVLLTLTALGASFMLSVARRRK
jgi:glucokinase